MATMSETPKGKWDVPEKKGRPAAPKEARSKVRSDPDLPRRAAAAADERSEEAADRREPAREEPRERVPDPVPVVAPSPRASRADPPAQSAARSPGERRLLLAVSAGLAILSCSLGLLLVSAQQEIGNLTNQVTILTGQLEAARHAPSAGDDGARLQMQNQMQIQSDRIARLEHDQGALRQAIDERDRRIVEQYQEIERLHDELKRYEENAGVPPSLPPSLPVPPPPRDPGIIAGGPPPGAPNPGAGENRPTEEWNDDARSEVDDLQHIVGLTDTERAQVEQIIVRGQREFEEAIARLQASGTGTYNDLEAIGNDISRRVEDEIASILPAEKAQLFRQYVADQRREYERYEGSSGPR